MKICLIGHYEKYRNEGGRNIAYCIAEELSKCHDVMRLYVWDISCWRKIRAFHPDIIHYIPDTLLAFALPGILSFPYKDAKTVLSMHHFPAFKPHSLYFKKLMHIFKPDIILTQSYESEQTLAKLGHKICFLPNGVNIEKFVPASENTKKKLREKYGLDKTKFIILHVGPIRRNRSVKIFSKIQQEDNDNQVLIVGRSGRSMSIERDVYKSLINGGCVVWTTYLKNMEEIYALSDCYIFPVVDKLGSVEMPLSVMEAMSCNLPVITTKFGALTRVFKEGDGLIFVDKEEDFISALKSVKSDDEDVKTREKVLPYSWENVEKKLEEIYFELIKGEI